MNNKTKKRTNLSYIFVPFLVYLLHRLLRFGYRFYDGCQKLREIEWKDMERSEADIIIGHKHDKKDIQCTLKSVCLCLTMKQTDKVNHIVRSRYKCYNSYDSIFFLFVNIEDKTLFH